MSEMHTFCYTMCFDVLKQLILRGSSGQTTPWKRLVHGSSSLDFGRSKRDLTVFYQSTVVSGCKVTFHFKALGYKLSLFKARTGLLYFQNMIAIFSEYTLTAIS